MHSRPAHVFAIGCIRIFKVITDSLVYYALPSLHCHHLLSCRLTWLLQTPLCPSHVSTPPTPDVSPPTSDVTLSLSPTQPTTTYRFVHYNIWMYFLCIIWHKALHIGLVPLWQLVGCFSIQQLLCISSQLLIIHHINRTGIMSSACVIYSCCSYIPWVYKCSSSIYCLSEVSNGNKPVCLQWRKLVRHQQEVHHTCDLFTIQIVKVQDYSCMCVRSFGHGFASLLLTALE